MKELLGQSLGQYRVLELIGQGGMARVYKAYQPALERYVAIKAIPARMANAQEQDFLQRFSIEARLVAKLAHPHIVPIHDFGQGDGWAYIVMEFISHGTVRERLYQAEATRTRLDLPWVLTITEQAAEALDFAHRGGIVHRDVKPGNMLLRADDFLLLSDFGIATILAARRESSDAHGTVGTPQYMAPEQIRPGVPVDGRADIYALGVVLFQCVTGRLPFNAESPHDIAMKHVSEAPPRPAALAPGLPADVERIILRALAKDPGARYPRASTMAEELRAARAALRTRAAATTSKSASVHGLNGGAYGIPVPMGAPGTPGTCFRCGAANTPQNRFCSSCGYDLSGKRAAADRYLLPSGRPLRCRLVFLNGPLAGRAFMLHQDTSEMGRAGGNDVTIPDGSVSRHHARLTYKAASWSIEDTGSSNGTWVNEVRIKRPARLQHGDVVRLGEEAFTFELVG